MNLKRAISILRGFGVPRLRKSYWSNSKLAGKIRGTLKPRSATAAGWNEWEKKAKAAHPIRYWIAEPLLDFLQGVVYWPIDVLRGIDYYVHNRFVRRYHLLCSPKLIPGDWHPFEDRVLYCLFDEFVAGLDRYGIEALTDDALSMGPDSMEQKALNLYHWWKNDFPNRPDPHVVSGINDFCQAMEQKYDPAGDYILGFISESLTPEEQDEWRKLYKKQDMIEAEYVNENFEKLQELLAVIKYHATEFSSLLG